MQNNNQRGFVFISLVSPVKCGCCRYFEVECAQIAHTCIIDIDSTTKYIFFVVGTLENAAIVATWPGFSLLARRACLIGAEYGRAGSSGFLIGPEHRRVNKLDWL